MNLKLKSNMNNEHLFMQITLHRDACDFNKTIPKM